MKVIKPSITTILNQVVDITNKILYLKEIRSKITSLFLVQISFVEYSLIMLVSHTSEKGKGKNTVNSKGFQSIP
jgi:hypothetical protein